MAATKPPALQFLVSNGVEKPNPELRKFIRSHVMLGKNRGRTLSAKKRALNAMPHASSVDLTTATSESESTARDLAESPTSSTTTSDSVLPVTVPRKFGYYTSAIQFPDSVEPSAVEVVLRFSSMAKQILFSLEPCILFERTAESWITPLTFDAVFLHTLIFTTRAYFDVIVSRKASVTQATAQHFVRALELLRERMGQEDNRIKLSDTTLAAIMTISSHALLAEDYYSARHHLRGVHKLISLRGGVSSFQRNRKLLIEILRCDVGMSLHTGSIPVFFTDTSSRESLPQYPDLRSLLMLRKSAESVTQSDATECLGEIDHELYQAWKAMSDFCSVINFAMDSKQLISFDVFADTMTSVMYHLIDLRFAATSSNEAIRLGLLAFSISIFLQWKTFGLSYARFTSEFRDCFTRLPLLEITPQLLLWILMIGSVSVFDVAHDVWLKQLLVSTMDLCEVHSWSEMRDLLNSFMWIGPVHDQSARRVFDAIVTQPDHSLTDTSLICFT